MGANGGGGSRGVTSPPIAPQKEATGDGGRGRADGELMAPGWPRQVPAIAPQE